MPGLGSAAQLSRDDRDVQVAPKNSSQMKFADGNRNGSRNAQVLASVPSTVITIRPPRSIVKKGEVICELDSASLLNQLINQKITVESAKMRYENANLARETAELAVVEYEEGLYKLQLQEAVGDTKIAEAELALAEHELKYTKDLVERKMVSTQRAQAAGSRCASRPDRARKSPDQGKAPP